MTTPPRTVLVTGASRGLGLGFVAHYLRQGAVVLAAARDPHVPTLDQMSQRFPGRVIPIELDVTSERSIRDLGQCLAERETMVDLLINNAGISVDEELGQWTAHTFAETFHVNAIGPAVVTKVLLPYMRADSLIVMITSGMGSLELAINAEGGLDAYAMSRAALNMLTRRLAVKLAPRQISVIGVNPGWVRTDMGGAQAPLSVEQAIGAMTSVVAGTAPSDSGYVFEHDGRRLPW